MNRNPHLDHSEPRRARLRVLAVAVAFAAVAIAVAVGEATAADGTGALTMGPQGMEGNLVVTPGTVLNAGYDFTIPGMHPAVAITFTAPTLAFGGRCVSSGAVAPLTVPMPSQTYAVPANNGQWFPSGDQRSALTLQGSVVVPDLCNGGSISLARGATFTAQVSSDVAVPGNGVNVRWHYSANGSSGSWSGTASVVPTLGPRDLGEF